MYQISFMLNVLCFCGCFKIIDFFCMFYVICLFAWLNGGIYLFIFLQFINFTGQKVFESDIYEFLNKNGIKF